MVRTAEFIVMQPMTFNASERCFQENTGFMFINHFSKTGNAQKP